jgi:UDP-glucose 4-epimerase
LKEEKEKHMNILVTGGAGYIGSHTCVELINNGYRVIIIDNFSNSKPKVLEEIKKITNKDFDFYKIDLCNKEALRDVFNKHEIHAAIHFAGLKSVGESVEQPLKYYKNNVLSSINLVEVMLENNIKNIVFSSSATVYGKPDQLPITEDFPTATTNPYGETKLMIERIYTDLYKSDHEWRISLLRYFNPIGAHESGLIGENPKGIPNNLMPYVTKVAKGDLDKLLIFGDDYKTIDGTGVRDYIHVVDLAKGHVKAIENLKTGVNIYNLGTGKGTSVLQLVNTFMCVNEVNVPYEIVDRRDGDIAACYADATKAKIELNWVARKNLKAMVKDAWRFEVNNN